MDGQEKEAARLGARLKRPASIRSSPARSGLQTAQALGLDPAVAIVTDPHLGDWDVGSWRGLPLADVAAQDEAGFQAWLAEPAAAPHGGETLLQLIERAGEWLHARCAERGRLVAVSHAAVLRAAVVHVLQAPAPAFWKVDAPPLSCLDLSSDGRRWTLRLPDGAGWPGRADSMLPADP